MSEVKKTKPGVAGKPTTSSKTTIKNNMNSAVEKKQAIYIGVDDDITTIIGNIKSSSANSIALVPPKRIGVLQSAVNLKLLSRAAKERHKTLSLVTNDPTLTTLAASARIPVTRSLSEEPQLADMPKVDNKDEIIEAEETPQIIIKNDDKSDSAAIQAIIDDDKIKSGDKNSKKPKNKKVPNFNKFRKWIILGVVALIGVVGLAVWLFVFAPHMTISINAKTMDEKIDQPIFVSVGGETNVAESKLKAVVPEPVKKTSEIEFTATGKRLVGGKKASGKATLTCTLVEGGGTCSVPSTINGYIVSSNQSGILGGASTEVTLTAPEEGAKYNSSGFTNTVLYVKAVAKQISGGEDKANETFVQQSDVSAITERLKSDTENNNMKADLEARFSNDVKAIPDSFQIAIGAVNSTPAIEAATGADGKARVSVEVVYTMYGLRDDDVNAVLMSAATKKLKGQNGQGVFDNGFKGVQILSYQNTDNGGSARLVTTAKIGPAINDQELKEKAKGKKQNEIKDELEKISGVERVEVKFFPPWLSVVDDESRITIEKSGF